MEDDILESILSADVSPVATSSQVPDTPEESKPIVKEDKKPTGKRGDSLWDATDIAKKAPDMSKFNKKGRNFSLILAATPDEDNKTKLIKIIQALAAKDFVMRYQYSDVTDFYKTLTDIEGLAVEAYLPWKKMAPELEHVSKAYATRQAYEMAYSYSAKFLTFPPAVRAIRANAMHCVLGPKLDNPSDLLICWSECGSEAFTKDIDFKKIGSLGTYFTYCKELNIPIYNINNKESTTKLVEYIKSK